MLKINLLAEGKRPVVARKKAATSGGGAGSSGDLGNYLLIAGIVLGLLVTAGWWLMLSNRISNKQEQIAEAKREVEELKAVIKEVEEYKRKKADLERKIQIINDLKANQRGPVQIMDEVSKGLPELLWLTSLETTNTNVSLRGSAFNMSAVANLIDNLDRVEAFGEPILQDATQRAGRGARTEVYDFRLSFPYSFKAPAAAPADGAGAPAAR